MYLNVGNWNWNCVKSHIINGKFIKILLKCTHILFKIVNSYKQIDII